LSYTYPEKFIHETINVVAPFSQLSGVVVPQPTGSGVGVAAGGRTVNPCALPSAGFHERTTKTAAKSMNFATDARDDGSDYF